MAAPRTPPSGDLARNSGVCPDWESTGNPSVHKLKLNPLTHTSKGCQVLKCFDIYLLYDTGIIFLGTYPKEVKAHDNTNTCMWMFTAALFVNSPKLGTTQMSISRWVNKLIAVHPRTGLSLTSKKKQTTDTHKKLDESQNNFAGWKKSKKDRVHTMKILSA